MSWVWWWVLPLRKRVAKENFQHAFPDMRPGPALREAVASMILGYAEFLRGTRKPCLDFEFQGFEPLLERTKSGKGSLVLTGHGGAWELIGLASARDLKLPVTLIARRPTSASARRLVARLRAAAGLEILPPEGSFFQASKALRAGRVVVFLLDQRHNGGVPVPFFGRPALTSKGLALLAKRTGSPVFGAWAFRRGVGKHRFVLSEALLVEGEPDEDTARFMAFTEARIRECPEHWLWLHARWRLPEAA